MVRHNLEGAPVLETERRLVARYNGSIPITVRDKHRYILHHGQGITRIDDGNPECEELLIGTMPDTNRDTLGVPAVEGVAVGSRPIQITLESSSATAPTLSLDVVSGELSDAGLLLGPTSSSDGIRYRYTWTYSPPAAIHSARPARVVATATISGKSRSASFSIYARPVVAVHGLWGSGRSFSDFELMFSDEYPAAAFRRVHYGDVSDRSFLDPTILARVAEAVQDVQVDARANGISVGEVDLIAHSMGGAAAAAYVQSVAQTTPWPGPGNRSIGRVVLIGSSMNGSALATWLLQNRDRRIVCDSGTTNPFVLGLCLTISGLTVEQALGTMGMPIGPGVSVLVPGSDALAQVRPGLTQAAVVASTTSYSELQLLFPILSSLAGAPATITSLLGPENDSVVALSSQIAVGMLVSQIEGLAHSPVLGTSNSSTQLGSPLTVRATARALGRTYKSPVIESPEIRGVEPSPLQEILAIDFSRMTRINAPSDAITPASAMAFSEFNLVLGTVPNCSLARLFGYEPFQAAYTTLPPSRQLVLRASKPGLRKITIVGVCNDSKYFIVDHSIGQSIPAAATLRFDPPTVAPVALGSSKLYRILTETGSSSFDVTEYASVQLSGNVALIEPGAQIRGLRPGKAHIIATYAGLTSQTDVFVNDLAGVGIFSSGME